MATEDTETDMDRTTTVDTEDTEMIRTTVPVAMEDTAATDAVWVECKKVKMPNNGGRSITASLYHILMDCL